jgi:hypothetical protein
MNASNAAYPKRPPAWFSLHARADDYRVTFFRGWLEKSRTEQDEALEAVFGWMRELVAAERSVLNEV